MNFLKCLQVDPKSSHHKEKCFFLSFFLSVCVVYVRQWMLTKLIVVIISLYTQKLSPCFVHIELNTVCQLYLSKTKKHKLESRLLGEISITSDMQMTPPLWQKVKGS